MRDGTELYNKWLDKAALSHVEATQVRSLPEAVVMDYVYCPSEDSDVESDADDGSE